MMNKVDRKRRTQLEKDIKRKLDKAEKNANAQRKERVKEIGEKN
jgi:hypothetical protein